MVFRIKWTYQPLLQEMFWSCKCFSSQTFVCTVPLRATGFSNHLSPLNSPGRTQTHEKMTFARQRMNICILFFKWNKIISSVKENWFLLFNKGAGNSELKDVGWCWRKWKCPYPRDEACPGLGPKVTPAGEEQVVTSTVLLIGLHNIL